MVGASTQRFRSSARSLCQSLLEADGPGEPAADAMQAIMEHENRCMQNHLAAVSTLKPGRLRRLTLRLALWAVGAFSRHHSRPGYLGDIGTIHFARWILLPGTDKLLFFSNYTGSWESYLGEFVDRASNGLTAVWSNTENFPKTAWVAGEGDVPAQEGHPLVGNAAAIFDIAEARRDDADY